MKFRAIENIYIDFNEDDLSSIKQYIDDHGTIFNLNDRTLFFNEEKEYPAYSLINKIKAICWDIGDSVNGVLLGIKSEIDSDFIDESKLIIIKNGHVHVINNGTVKDLDKLFIVHGESGCPSLDIEEMIQYLTNLKEKGYEKVSTSPIMDEHYHMGQIFEIK